MRLLLSSARRHGPALVAGVASLLLGFQVFAQDIAAGVDDASSQFKSLIGKGVAVAALVVAVISLSMAGFRFSQKDPHAVWYLAGTLVGGVLFAVAKSMMGR